MKTINASELKAGDKIPCKNGSLKTVKSVKVWARVVDVLFANHNRVTMGLDIQVETLPASVERVS